MTWYTFNFKQASLFSLRPSNTTSKGGVSLLIPSPYSFKMALFDVYCRHYLRTPQGKQHKEDFELIRDLDIHIKPPEYIAVNGSIVKIMDATRKDSQKDKSAYLPPFKPSIAYREYVFWQGELSVAFQVPSTKENMMEELVKQINYIGKRGGFIQMMSFEKSYEKPSFEGYSQRYSKDIPVSSRFIIQYLDDMGKNMTFKKLSPYDSATIKIKEDERFSVKTILPMKLIKADGSSRVYKRI